MPSLPPAIDLVVHRQGDGPPLVALHDIAGDGRGMLGALDLLSDEFTVVAPDLRGHGASPTPKGPWSVDDFSSDIARLVAKEARGCVVVGVGLGAATAISLALGHPGLISGLVLSGIGPRKEDVNAEDRWARVARAVRERGGTHAEGIALATEALGMRPDWRAALAQVDVPAVVLAGAGDRAVPAEAQRELSAWIRHARFRVVSNAGHNVAADHPDAIAAAVHSLAADPRPAALAA
ncbi:MAG TPA: alpha/beta fold hydrolase [Miltoncostaeaceae bacterium]|nr:alpha/beta fold hydrolase [Miltoncostaeaceae bacterium]